MAEGSNQSGAGVRCPHRARPAGRGARLGANALLAFLLALIFLVAAPASSFATPSWCQTKVGLSAQASQGDRFPNPVVDAATLGMYMAHAWQRGGRGEKLHARELRAFVKFLMDDGENSYFWYCRGGKTRFLAAFGADGSAAYSAIVRGLPSCKARRWRPDDCSLRKKMARTWDEMLTNVPPRNLEARNAFVDSLFAPSDRINSNEYLQAIQWDGRTHAALQTVRRLAKDLPGMYACASPAMSRAATYQDLQSILTALGPKAASFNRSKTIRVMAKVSGRSIDAVGQAQSCKVILKWLDF